MKKPDYRIVALLMFALFFCGLANAQIELPRLSGRVIDQTGTLSPDQISALTEQSALLEKELGSQIAVLMLLTTKPEEIEQFGIRLAEFWKIGRESADDGIILVIAKNDRKTRIEIGRGLEGAIPDAIAKRIIEDQINPHFKAGNFYAGVAAGLGAISSAIRGESNLQPAELESEPLPQLNFPEFSIFMAFAGIFFSSFLNSTGMSRILSAALSGAVSGVVVLIFTFSLIGALIASAVVTLLSIVPLDAGSSYNRSRGGYGGSSSWRSSSGGGFSGGGGSFGGGGASGGW